MDTMCEMNLEHRKKVQMENGVKGLYLRILKSLYGCMESAILWYNIYAKTLKLQGLVVNPYHRCIESSRIDNKQCAISWYVDSNKSSHVDEHVNTRIIEAAADFFCGITVLRGSKHRFLEIDIEFLGNGIVSLIMKDCIEQSIS